ncbi:acid protease [Ganoderma leucocontextum]|nr:acid protease [Ganoderma leucocontextum]
MRLSCFRLSLFLRFFSAANVLFATAATISLEGIRRSSGATAHALAERVGVVDLQNSGDLEYYTNVTLGGRSYRVLVDSGSADLWVAGEVPKSTATPHVVTIHYGDTYVLGKVNTATLHFAGVTVVNQSYVEQAVDSSHPVGQGVLGIGASRLSSVLSALSAPSGNPVIDNLIAVQDSGANFVTSLVSRPVDGSDTILAQLTIGEVVSDHVDVQSAVQLPVSKNGWDSHWLVSLDDSGIIGPDNLAIRASEGTKLKVVFDSGYTMSQVSDEIAAAIYSRVPGAKLTTIDASPSPVWTVPCDFELNVTFKFGGVAYPVHPLDTVMQDIMGPVNDQGSAFCVGAFQPTNVSNPYDILLGMTFLRNAYILMDLGDQPYVQLRSLTDPAQAHLEFVQQRLGGVDTTGSQQLLRDTAGLSDNSTSKSAVDRNQVFIIAGAVIGSFVLLCILGILGVWYRKRRLLPLRRSSKTPEPKSPLRILSLPFFVHSKHKSAATVPGQVSPSHEEYQNSLARKTGAGDLMPNWESVKTQSMLAAAPRSPIGVPRLPGVESASLLDNAAAPGIKPSPESPRDHSSVYAQEDGPILIIGEKPLPIPGSDEEGSLEKEEVYPAVEGEADHSDLSLSSSSDHRQLTNSFALTMPSTPATLRAPARADTPNPYDLPPLPPPLLLADSPPAQGATASRPLPNPHTMPGNRRHSRVTISAFESLFGRSATRRSKPSVLPSLNTSSAMLGREKPTSESKKSSRVFSLRRSRGRP